MPTFFLITIKSNSKRVTAVLVLHHIATALTGTSLSGSSNQVFENNRQ